MAEAVADRLDHVRRVPLPWRDDGLTECGLVASEYQALTSAEFIAKARDLGQQRMAMVTCMNCYNTAMRWQGHRLRREERGVAVSVAEPGVMDAIERTFGRVWGMKAEERDLLTREFTAIVMLVDAHREEFDAAVAGLGDATNLATVRSAKKAAAARASMKRRR